MPPATTTLPAPLRPHALVPDVAYVPDFVSEREEEALLRHLKPPTTAAAAAAAGATDKSWRVLSGRRLKTLGGSVDRGALTAAPLPSWLLPLIERLRLTGAYAEEGQGGEGEKGEKTEAPCSSPSAPTSLAASTSSASTSASTSPASSFPPPNHALVNCYRSGEGILPHEDGPIYHPAAAIVSLGSWAVLRFYSKRSDEDDDEEEDEEGRGRGRGQGQAEEAKGEEGEGKPPRSSKGGTRNVFSVALAPRSLVVFTGEAYKSLLHGIEAVAEEALDASVLNAEDERVRGAASKREAAAAASDGGGGGGSSSSSALFVIPRGGGSGGGEGGESAERVSLTVRRVLRVRRNLLRLGPR